MLSDIIEWLKNNKHIAVVIAATVPLLCVIAFISVDIAFNGQSVKSLDASSNFAEVGNKITSTNSVLSDTNEVNKNSTPQSKTLSNPASNSQLKCEAKYQSDQEAIYEKFVIDVSAITNGTIASTKTSYADMRKRTNDINALNLQEYESLSGTIKYHNERIQEFYNDTLQYLIKYGCTPTVKLHGTLASPKYPEWVAKPTPTIAQCNEALKGQYKSEYDSLVAAENTEFNQLMAYINNPQNFDNSGSQVIAHTNATNSHKQELSGYKNNYESKLKSINCY